MEQPVTLPTADGHMIYGVLRKPQESSDSLIIFVHGLTGHMNEHMHYNGARFFTKNGYATFRFDLYTGEEKGRKLQECTLQTHTADLNTVLSHFAGKYKKIHLVGHSFGGPTICLSTLDPVHSIVLWDPTIDTKSLLDEVVYNKEKDHYYTDWGTQCLLSKDMVEEWKTVSITPPTKSTLLIFAGDGIIHKGLEQTPFKDVPHKIIPEASHCFDEDGTEEELFQHTLEWFEKDH